jgi:hypothetical protein
MEPNNYDEIPLCELLYFVSGMGQLAESSRWECTIFQKMVAVHGSPSAPTPLILILIRIIIFILILILTLVQILILILTLVQILILILTLVQILILILTLVQILILIVTLVQILILIVILIMILNSDYKLSNDRTINEYCTGRDKNGNSYGLI